MRNKYFLKVSLFWGFLAALLLITLIVTADCFYYVIVGIPNGPLVAMGIGQGALLVGAALTGGTEYFDSGIWYDSPNENLYWFFGYDESEKLGFIPLWASVCLHRCLLDQSCESNPAVSKC